MRLLLFIIISIQLAMSANAQKKYRFELGLENGEIVGTNTIKHVEDRGYFQVKRDRYKYEEVVYFRDRSSYYLKSEPGPSMYLRRVEGAKVCAYSGRRSQNKAHESDGYSGMFGNADTAGGIGEFEYYYQKIGESFKKMNIDNLREDLKDNEASMLILSEIENSKNNASNRTKMLEALDVYNKYEP